MARRVKADNDGHAPPADTPRSALIDYYAALARSELGRCIQNAHERGDTTTAEALRLKEHALSLGAKRICREPEDSSGEDLKQP